jgi:hypothetical protein
MSYPLTVLLASNDSLDAERCGGRRDSVFLLPGYERGWDPSTLRVLQEKLWGERRCHMPTSFTSTSTGTRCEWAWTAKELCEAIGNLLVLVADNKVDLSHIAAFPTRHYNLSLLSRCSISPHFFFLTRAHSFWNKKRGQNKRTRIKNNIVPSWNPRRIVFLGDLFAHYSSVRFRTFCTWLSRSRIEMLMIFLLIYVRERCWWRIRVV